MFASGTRHAQDVLLGAHNWSSVCDGPQSALCTSGHTPRTKPRPHSTDFQLAVARVKRDDTEALSAELPRDFTRTGEQLQKHLRFVLKCSFPCTMQLVAQVFTGLTAKLHMFGSGRNS